jgi:uncharacterized protein YkwD
MLGPGFAQKVIEEVNKIRLNPKTYSNKIRGYLSCFQGNVLRIPKQPGLMTTEGPSAYKEAADFLLSLPKLQSLTADSGLTSAAQEMAEELGKCQDFDQMDSIDRESIINKYGRYEGQFGESTDFGSLSPEMVVVNLLVDDGNQSRSNRRMLFKETYRKVGCGCVPHNKFKSVTVIMYASNYIAGGSGDRVKLVKNNKTTLAYGPGGGVGSGQSSNSQYGERQEPGYSKELRTEQDIKNSGIPYRYVNNVDPNKDLITDSAKYGGPLNISKNGNATATFKQEDFQQGTQAENPNYRQKLDLSGKGATKVGGGGSILNTNVESSGWTPSLQNSDYVKARQRAEQEDLLNNQYRVKLPDTKTTSVGGGGSILNTNVESSGWTPSLQRNYKPPPQEEENNYMSRMGKNVKTTKVGGGGSILNTNVESSGWVTDFEKQKDPSYWKAKQEYQDNYRGMAPIGPAVGRIEGGGAIGNTNVESADWNDYSGYERRIPYYHEEKKYDNAPTKEERYGYQQQKVERNYEYEAPKQEKGGYAQESLRREESFPDMQGVMKVEKSEKIINEGGKQIKLTKLVKYMENGEIKTEITKSKI